MKQSKVLVAISDVVISLSWILSMRRTVIFAGVFRQKLCHLCVCVCVCVCVNDACLLEDGSALPSEESAEGE